MSESTVYKYSGLTPSGEKVHGQFFGKKEDLQRNLQAQGVLLLELKEQKTKLQSGKFSEADFLSAIEQLYHLTVSGMRLDLSIQTVINAARKEHAHAFWSVVLHEVKQGTTLSVAIAHSSNAVRGWKVPQLYCQIIGIGEEVGDITEAMRRLLEHLEFRKSLKSELLSALSYPAFLLVMSCVSIAIVILVIVPRFMTVFQPEQLTNLPMISKIVFSLGGLGGEHLRTVLTIILTLILCVLLFRQRIAPLVGVFTVKALNLLPITRKPLRHLDLADVYTALGSMLEGGVGVHHSLIQAAGTARLPALSFLLTQTARHVKEGQTIQSLWVTSNLIPGEDVSLIAVGESSASLGALCLKLGKRHMEQFRIVVRGIMTLFEPAIILLLGCGIGAIVTGILLAVLSMTDIAGM